MSGLRATAPAVCRGSPRRMRPGVIFSLLPAAIRHLSTVFILSSDVEPQAVARLYRLAFPEPTRLGREVYTVPLGVEVREHDPPHTREARQLHRLRQFEVQLDRLRAEEGTLQQKQI